MWAYIDIVRVYSSKFYSTLINSANQGPQIRELLVTGVTLARAFALIYRLNGNNISIAFWPEINVARRGDRQRTASGEKCRGKGEKFAGACRRYASRKLAAVEQNGGWFSTYKVRGNVVRRMMERVEQELEKRWEGEWWNEGGASCIFFQLAKLASSCSCLRAVSPIPLLATLFGIYSSLDSIAVTILPC